MKPSTYLFIATLLTTEALHCQLTTIDQFIQIKPSEIITGNREIGKYDVTLKWQNIDPINGTKFNCNAVNASYITLPNDSVAWNNVTLAQISDFQQTVFSGSPLPSFNGFSYKINATNFLNDQFYHSISPEQRDLAKWLVSDAIQMQGLARYIFDSLSFNKPFSPSFLKNYDITFNDWVTFTSRYQKLTWTGITKYNNQVCAIIKFESLYNPLKVDNSQMSVMGRSLYYGELWISLSDKQVEYAAMTEDVIMKLKSSAFPDEQLIELQREVAFKKIN